MSDLPLPRSTRWLAYISDVGVLTMVPVSVRFVPDVDDEAYTPTARRAVVYRNAAIPPAFARSRPPQLGRAGKRKFEQRRRQAG
jgi:hypothetical protein